MVKSVSITGIDIGIKNFAMATIRHRSDKSGYVLKHKLFELDNSSTINRLKSISAILSLIHKRDENYLVVEQQVGGKNNTAYGIQMGVMMWGVTNGFSVESFAAANKFKLMNVSYNTATKEHKRLAEKYASNVIDVMGGARIIAKKKDDVSDAICMAFIKFNELIPTYNIREIFNHGQSSNCKFI